MTADSAQVRALIQVKQRNYLRCAGLLLGTLPLHGLLAGSFLSLSTGVHLGWALGFLGLRWLLGAGWVSVRGAGGGAGLISLAPVAVLIHASGGLASPYFYFLAAIPLAIALFTPDSRVPTAVAVVGTLVALLLLLVVEGVRPQLLLLHLVNFSLMGGVALVGARMYGRIREAERTAQQERLVALEQLAESERRRVRAERERAEVERLVLVGQLAAGVAHEVNNPLAFVKSNLCFLEQEMLREGVLDRDETLDVLAETQQGVMRIQQIVADLRRFSREGAGSEEEGVPEEAVGEAKRLASVRLRSLGEVALDVAVGLPRVRLGQRQLVQVLLNLLLNAADAVEAAAPSRRAHIVMRARAVEGGVRLEVEDNGSGLPEEVRARLFTPFFTTKPPGKGTGLGLALCHEYVTRVGGTLVAEDRPEGGARFSLTLPALGEEVVAPAAAGPSSVAA
jgi:C4-dicarboxylate-specific signal transduction histidine kinase